MMSDKITFSAYEVYNKATNKFEGILISSGGVNYSQWYIGRTAAHINSYRLMHTLKEKTRQEIEAAGYTLKLNPSFELDRIVKPLDQPAIAEVKKTEEKKQTLKQKLLARGIDQRFVKERFGDLRTNKAKKLALAWMHKHDDDMYMWETMKGLKAADVYVRNVVLEGGSNTHLHMYQWAVGTDRVDGKLVYAPACEIKLPT